MAEILLKIATSKYSFIILVIVVVALALFQGATSCQKKVLENKVEEMQKTIDKQEADIVELENSLRLREYELQLTKNSLQVAQEFMVQERRIREEADEKKRELLETVANSEEAKDWWNSLIPDSILDDLTCDGM